MIKQKARGVMSLVSVPSTPVTVASLLLGYATVTGTVINQDVIALIVVGALGHWAFYGLNDIVDLKWDKEQERIKKPLVRGDISLITASVICSALGIGSVVLALYLFQKITFLFWLSACIFGLIYDYRSKTDIYAGVYMAFWGVSVIYTGALYAGRGIGGTTVILAVLMGGHMLWMTIMGNLKDVGQGEMSIPEKLSCKIIDDNGYKHLWTSIRFKLVSMPIILIQTILLLLLPIGDGAQAGDIPFVYAAIIGSVAIWVAYTEVLYQPGFSEVEMKKDIALYEVVSVISILIVSISFIDITSAVSLFSISVIWGLIWQTVMYGHPLQFP